MDRRTLLKLAATSSLLSVGLPPPSFADPASTHTGPTKRRVRPGDPDWPSPAEWNRLKEAVGGRLINVESPLAGCAGSPDTPACQELLRNLRNPFFIGDQPWERKAAVGSMLGYRRRASMQSQPKMRATLRPRSISLVNTICASLSKAAGTAFTARRTRQIR